MVSSSDKVLKKPSSFPPLVKEVWGNGSNNKKIKSSFIFSYKNYDIFYQTSGVLWKFVLADGMPFMFTWCSFAYMLPDLLDAKPLSSCLQIGLTDLQSCLEFWWFLRNMSLIAYYSKTATTNPGKKRCKKCNSRAVISYTNK